VERANRRLSSTETFTVTPSRHLAHYVAGLLAATRRDPRIARIRAAVAAAGGPTADVAMYDDLRASSTLIADENGRISDAPPVAARHDPFLSWWDDPRAT